MAIPVEVRSFGPGPAEVGRQRIYVKFASDADLGRGVAASRLIGGTVFLGVAKEPRSGIRFVVFETENDASKLMADIMGQGVKISSVVVKGMTEAGPVVRGLVPVVVECRECGARMLYRDSFSSTGVQLCDACLAKVIEGP